MSTEKELDLDAYLERVDYGLGLEPSPETLAALHQAHLAAIPFENLDILLGRPIELDLASLQRKMIGGRRGGYCFEHNTLFHAVLERLGFCVSALAARVRVGSTAVRPRTHMLLRVDHPQGSFLADVGFGGDGPVLPLQLAEGPQMWCGGAGHRLRREEDLWVLEGNLGEEWVDLYAFTLEPQYPVDFVMANHFTSTFPSSPFVQNLTAQRSTAEGRTLLRNLDLVRRSASAVETSRVTGPEELLEVLSEDFGLSFPPETRFSRPEFDQPREQDAGARRRRL